MIKGIFIILLFLFLGEGGSMLIGGLIPGSVMGMILLFVALCLKIVKPADIRTVADFLTKNMALFFVPASIGVMASWQVVARNWQALGLMTVISTVLVIAVVAHIQQFAEKRKKK